MPTLSARYAYCYTRLSSIIHNLLCQNMMSSQCSQHLPKKDTFVAPRFVGTKQFHPSCQARSNAISWRSQRGMDQVGILVGRFLGEWICIGRNFKHFRVHLEKMHYRIDENWEVFRVHVRQVVCMRWPEWFIASGHRLMPKKHGQGANAAAKLFFGS